MTARIRKSQTASRFYRLFFFHEYTEIVLNIFKKLNNYAILKYSETNYYKRPDSKVIMANPIYRRPKCTRYRFEWNNVFRGFYYRWLRVGAQQKEISIIDPHNYTFFSRLRLILLEKSIPASPISNSSSPQKSNYSSTSYNIYVANIYIQHKQQTIKK